MNEFNVIISLKDKTKLIKRCTSLNFIKNNVLQLKFKNGLCECYNIRFINEIKMEEN